MRRMRKRYMLLEKKSYAFSPLPPPPHTHTHTHPHRKHLAKSLDQSIQTPRWRKKAINTSTYRFPPSPDRQGSKPTRQQKYATVLLGVVEALILGRVRPNLGKGRRKLSLPTHAWQAKSQAPGELISYATLLGIARMPNSQS